MKDDLLGYVIVLFVLCIGYKMYLDSDFFHLTCVLSKVDGETYCVRERKNIHKASDLLAKTANKMNTLVEYLKTNIRTMKWSTAWWSGSILKDC